jgi:hypothetical protein
VRQGAQVLFLVLAFAATSRAEFSVFRPSLGVPEFSVTSGTFRVEVRASPGLASNGWTVVLANDLRGWTGAVERVDYGWCVENNAATGYCLTVRAPSAAPPELFDLLVSHPSAGAATNRHTVSILRSFDSDFYILHYADPQASASNALSASGMNTPYGSIQEMYWHAPVFTLINPRFMFNTGDELDDGDVDTVNRYAQYIAAANTFGPPLIITRGNNDRGAVGHWRTNIGAATFSLRMGSFYICMKDYNANDYYAWFTNDYAASFQDTNITYRLFGQHYNSGASSYAPAAGQYPDLMLVGHIHSYSTVQAAPYYVLSSGAAHNYGGVGMFSFAKSGTNWLCAGITNRASFNPVGDWGAPRVTNWYANANDGTQTTNTAFVTNSLPYRFFDGRVRFLLRRTCGGYTVSGGEKLAEYDYGASNSAVLVKVDIASNALTQVSVSRVDSDDDGIADDWELATFTNLTTATSASDYDDDEFLDWEEYVAGTSATNSGSFLRLTNFTAQSGYVFSWPSATSRVYAVYWSSNLLQGFQPFATDIDPTPPLNTYTDTWHAASTAGFYRIWLRKF